MWPCILPIVTIRCLPISSFQQPWSMCNLDTDKTLVWWLVLNLVRFGLILFRPATLKHDKHDFTLSKANFFARMRKEEHIKHFNVWPTGLLTTSQPFLWLTGKCPEKRNIQWVVVSWGVKTWGQRSDWEEWFPSHRKATGTQTTGHGHVLAPCSHCHCPSYEFYSVEARQGKVEDDVSGAFPFYSARLFPNQPVYFTCWKWNFFDLKVPHDVVSTLQTHRAVWREQSGTEICSGSLRRILMGLCAGKQEWDSHPSFCPRNTEQSETACRVDLITESTWQKVVLLVFWIEWILKVDGIFFL